MNSESFEQALLVALLLIFLSGVALIIKALWHTARVRHFLTEGSQSALSFLYPGFLIPGSRLNAKGVWHKRKFWHSLIGAVLAFALMFLLMGAGIEVLKGLDQQVESHRSAVE